TTAKHVVQLTMSTNQSANQFVCTDSTGGSETAPNDCLIIQASSGSANNATCFEKIGDPTSTQHCAIFQLNTSGANNASVQQQIAAVSGTTQAATQLTEIAQWNASGSNTAQVNQDLKESQSASLASTASITQTQDGHQTTSVSQHSDTGDNGAKVV